MIVLKFGGTSVGDVDRVREAAKIIEAQPQPRAAVVSAVSGVTNLLLEAAAAASAGASERAAAVAAQIRARHDGVAAGISIVCTPRSMTRWRKRMKHAIVPIACLIRSYRRAKNR